MKRAFFVILLFLIPTSVIASEVVSPKAKVENFFGLLQKGNVHAAYDQLLKGSSIPMDKPQAVTVLKQQTQTGLPLYGKALRYELVHEEKLTNSVIRLVYFLILEKAPTTWEFYFYRPKSDWFLANVIFNDQFQFLGRKK